jgi:hypothetical protein
MIFSRNIINSILEHDDGNHVDGIKYVNDNPTLPAKPIVGTGLDQGLFRISAWASSEERWFCFLCGRKFYSCVFEI